MLTPPRIRTMNGGVECGLSPNNGLDRAKFLSVVSESPELIATLRTQSGWAHEHLTMLGGAHNSATSLLEQIELQLGVTEDDDT